MSDDNSPPPPYSPNEDRSTEIKTYVDRANELKADFASLVEYTRNVRATDFGPTHQREISEIQVESRRLQNAYDDYLTQVVNPGAATLKAHVKEFGQIIVPMLIDDRYTPTDKEAEIKQFLQTLPPKLETSLERLNELKPLGPETFQHSVKYTRLLGALMEEKNAIVDSAKEELVKEQKNVEELEQQRRELPSKGILDLITGRDSSDEKRKEIDQHLGQLHQKIVKLKRDIEEANFITAKLAPTPQEFNKRSDNAGNAIEQVPANLRSTMIKVFSQMKLDADSFRYALDHPPINVDHVNHAKTQWQTVYDVLTPLTRV